jgi:hypothetical protein
MEGNEYILDLIRDLVTHHVKFVVCGGVAVILQGVERLTMDLDLSVDMTKENLTRFLRAVEKNNLSPRAPIPAESLLDKDIVKALVEQKHATVFTFIDKANPFRQIDVFITEQNRYDAIVKDSIEIVVDTDTSFRIASIDKLIEMKKEIKPVREKDLYDIKRLTELKKKIDEK